MTLRILLTLPVTAATAERSFLKVKIIKNYFQSKISRIRLVGLAMTSIEKKISDQLDMHELILEFSKLKAGKENLK